ncbi:Ras-related GTP-binding protein D [Histomonas meleagridis]|uniref:Ras-related GTP-binding protein D n=1 Tax=Histomonas meleagridis TaxID=135588 RepID=UPI003559E9EB|nr:Ras-related GTP-binding protein D [Histomonas meleagridis]KAH0802806.1 Ras-related GTP-binding protein D [Histomonas meleagridis]
MVSFPNCIDLGPIVFVGNQGSGKYSILSQLTDKFKISPNDSQGTQAEIRNVMIKFQIVDCPDFFASSNPLSIFSGCKGIVLVLDCTDELPIDLIMSVNNIRDSISPSLEVHVFLNKVDLLDPQNGESILSNITSQISSELPNSIIHNASITDGSALLHISRFVESLIPKKELLMKEMNNFIHSLGLSHAFLVDLQSRIFFLGFDEALIDLEQFAAAHDAVDMFVGTAAAMEARNSQPTASVQLKDGTFVHFFWSTYDVILVGISSHRIPIATAKNNVLVLLHSIKKIMKSLNKNL